MDYIIHHYETYSKKITKRLLGKKSVCGKERKETQPLDWLNDKCRQLRKESVNLKI